MPYKYLRGKVWWAAYYKGDKKIQLSLKTRDRTHAQYKLDKLKVQLSEGKETFPSKISWDEFYKGYKTYCETTKAPNTYKRDYKVIDQFIKHLAPTKLKDITTKTIREYLNYKLQGGIKPRTANRIIETVKAMLNYAVKHDYLPENPAKQITKLKQPQNPPRFLSKEEINKLLEAAKDSNLYPMIIAGLYTGARLSELQSLEWPDFDWEKKILTIRNKEGYQTKTKKFRTIPLHPELINRLKPYTQETGRCFNTNGNLYWPLHYILDKVELKGVGWHTFRHTFASHLTMRGVDLTTVSRLLGHAQISTTMIYAHLSDEHIKKAIDNLPY